MSQNQQPTRCTRCGAELPSHLPADLCPKCLLQAGLGTQPQKGPEDTVILPQPAALRGIPQPGEDFGHYRLVRLLGQGGMGVVFEAEDLETGRRVALKILSQALDSPEARKRFLREGQIAAAINHPNSVYVFGTEEIAGTPVIAMELVAGGTLRDRVVASGPLPAAEAVDVILQIIAGLEAAQQAGVLHRDIKPSNCFVDSDGTIKIGDFGLSITTAVRTESNLTGAGSLFGTPAFSSPEQLRGEELTVRSDIYSVGVTLYYLLTGRMPFEAPNIVQLLVTVLEQQPQSPAKLRPGIPGGLARAVLRCLSKDPGARFESYAALRRALLPYASFSPTPATLALRFAAWAIDTLILSAPGWVLFLLVFSNFSDMTNPGHAGKKMLASAISFLLVVLYFGLFEGLRGASPGKALCRLRVAGLDGNTPGLMKGLLRALCYYGFVSLPGMAWSLFGSDWMLQHPGDLRVSFAGIIPAAMQLLLFCTCRRQNGFAALHDLWSRTRVLSQPVQLARPALPPALETPPAIGEVSQIGPYHVLAEMGRSAEATVLLGYDARLLRKVWLRRVSPATPPVATALRRLARPGRLRWLNGQRAGDDGWDAYDASAGQPLLKLVSSKQDWEKVRFWLLDLAEELKVAEKDGSLPPGLSLDRIWITSDGHAKLLDFPAPGINLPSANEPPQLSSPQEFLHQAAITALTGRPLNVEQARAYTLEMPLPLYARGFLQRLGNKSDATQMWAQLKPLVGKVATISRRRRWAMLAIALGFPIFSAAMQLLGGFLMSSKNNAEIFALQSCLIQCRPLEPAGTNAPSQPTAVDEKRQQFEIYIAGRFRPVITNSVAWNGLMARSLILPEQKVLAERIVTVHPKITPDEFTAAKTVTESQFHIIPPAAVEQSPVFSGMSFMLPVIFYVSTLMFVVIPCFAGALLFRGGLAMRVLGMAVVGKNGKPSRARTLWRNFIAWLPFLCSPMLVKAAENFVGTKWSVLVAAGVLALVALCSLLLRRSLQDRLAGTWLVPDGATAEVEPVLGEKNKPRFPFLPVAAGVGLLVGLVLLALFSRYLIQARNDSMTTPVKEHSAVEKLAAKSCVTLLSDGTPAAETRVWIGTEKNPALNCFRPDDYYPFGMEKIKADASGRFDLPAVTDNTLVIVTHPAGILVTTAAELRKTARVRLQPFSRVEGLLLSEGKPRPGAQISVNLLPDQRGLDMSYSAVSGEDGRFVFTNLAAGEYRLYRVFPPRRRLDGGFSAVPSHQKIITVNSGVTVKVQWGGDGRPVIGQAAPENLALAVDWLNDSHSLELVHVSAATSLTKFVRESYGLGTSSVHDRKEIRTARSYHLEFEADGSFRAEDVPPGNYELRIRVTKPGPPGRDRFLHEGEVLGSLLKTVTIPAGTGPFDLGRQTVSIKGDPAVALTLPLDANWMTLDGKSLTLASLRGQYVVLVFWASWSEPSKKTLAALQKVRDEFASAPGVAFLAVSVDDAADSLKPAAASANYGFTLGRLALAERASVAETFDITKLPAVFLLGPDGRISARDLEAERLKATLQRALSPH